MFWADGILGPIQFLYLTHESPWPANAGHKLRYDQLVRALCELGDVHLASFEAPDGDTLAEGQTGSPLPASHVSLVPHRVRIRRHPLAFFKAAAHSILSVRPYSEVKFENPQMARTVASLLDHLQPTAILATLPMLQYVANARRHTRVYLDAHNIEHQLWSDAQDLVAAPLRPWMKREAGLLKQREELAWQSVDGVLSLCDADTHWIRQVSVCPVLTVPPALHHLVHQPSPPTHVQEFPFDAVMLGVWTWAPNELALAHLARALEQSESPAGLRLCIGGRGIRRRLRDRLRAAGVEVLGYVQDLDEFYAKAACVLAPYSLAGGVKLKVLEAMGRGVPVVGTEAALRGIRGPQEQGVVIGADASELLHQVARLRQDPARRLSLAQSAMRRVSREHSPSSAHEALGGFFARKPSEAG